VRPIGERPSSTPEQELDGRAVALICCGALAREVRQVADDRGWEVDLYGIPALYHLFPAKIVRAVDEQLSALTGRYDRIVVAYGDCGTSGALDEVIARHGAVRMPGPHCYEMFAGSELERILREDPRTYFLTDFLVRHWEPAVVAGLGLDRRPGLKELCFEGFSRVVFLRQVPDSTLEAKASEIAAFLGLPLEVRDLGLGELESRLVTMVEG
jgi:hypothetical protein